MHGRRLPFGRPGRDLPDAVGARRGVGGAHGGGVALAVLLRPDRHHGACDGLPEGEGDVEVVVRTTGRAVARATMIYAVWIKEAVIIMVIVKVNKKKPSMS